MSEVEESEDRVQLTPEQSKRRAEALKQVRQWGDPVLKTVARPVVDFDQALRDQLQRMSELMKDSVGVGLAANQFGALNRVLVYSEDGGETEVKKIVNPVIVWHGEEQEPGGEGCLSLQGVSLEVDRYIEIKVEAQDEFGETVQIEANGFEARILQHEIDHLDGILILDRVDKAQRKEALTTLRQQLLDEL